MAPPSSNFSNSLECIAFSAGAPRQSSDSSNSARNPKICGHGGSIFEFFEFFGMYRVFFRCPPSIFEFFEFFEKFEDGRRWSLHLRIFRILWNVSRFLLFPRAFLRNLRIFRRELVEAGAAFADPKRTKCFGRDYENAFPLQNVHFAEAKRGGGKTPLGGAKRPWGGQNALCPDHHYWDY